MRLMLQQIGLVCLEGYWPQTKLHNPREAGDDFRLLPGSCSCYWQQFFALFQICCYTVAFSKSRLVSLRNATYAATRLSIDGINMPRPSDPPAVGMLCLLMS